MTLPAIVHEVAATDLAQFAVAARRIQESLGSVDDVRVATRFVRQTSAAEKLLYEAMKTWRTLDRDQFALRQDVAEAHLRTQRRAGQLLIDLPKHGGGRSRASRTADSAVPQTLQELGIDVHESHRWQLMASVPGEVFDEFICERRELERELTSAAVLTFARQLRAAGSGVRPSSRAALLSEYDLASAELAVLVGADAGRLGACVAPRHRERELGRLRSLRLWIAEATEALRTTPFVGPR